MGGQRRGAWTTYASVLANAVADDGDAGALARDYLRKADEITAPDLVDVETVSVLRKQWLRRTLTEERFSTAVVHLYELGFERPDPAVDPPCFRVARQRQRLRRVLCRAR